MEKSTDAEAVKYHLEDVLEDEMEGVKIWGDVAETKLSKMP